MLENNASDIELVKEIGIKLLKNKFSFQNVIVIPANQHSLQEDGSSCGAYVCYYAKRICEGLPMFFSSNVFAHAYFWFLTCHTVHTSAYGQNYFMFIYIHKIYAYYI